MIMFGKLLILILILIERESYSNFFERFEIVNLLSQVQLQYLFFNLNFRVTK